MPSSSAKLCSPSFSTVGGMEDSIRELWLSTGLANFRLGQILMMLVGGTLLFLAIRKKFEPLLLVPIGFGAILSNIPIAAMAGPEGLLGYVYAVGIETGGFSVLIFFGVRG